MKKNLVKAIIIFSFLGILISAYSSYHHYTNITGICNINEKLSCDIVNRSEYSELFGIPVALIGLFGYLAILITSVLLIKNETKELKLVLLVLSSAGFLFTAYLTYIEAFVLYTYCPLCLTSAAFITIMLVISIILLKKG